MLEDDAVVSKALAEDNEDPNFDRKFARIKRSVQRAIYRLIGREFAIEETATTNNRLQRNESHQVCENFAIVKRLVQRAIYRLIGREFAIEETAITDNNRLQENISPQVIEYLGVIGRFVRGVIYRLMGRRIGGIAGTPVIQPNISQPDENEDLKDIISCLPPEVSQYILRWLSPDDLENCLGVSMSWRFLTNANIVWKDHCLRFATPNKIKNIQTGNAPIPNLRQIQVFGVEEPDIEECCMDIKYRQKIAYAVDLLKKSKKQGLIKCKLAEAYETMRANVLSNWLTGRCSSYSFDMGTDVRDVNEKELQTFWSKDGSLGYICSSKFHVVLQFAWSDESVLSLPFNDDMRFHNPSSVAFSNRYFALTSGPAIRIMKREEYGYTFFKQYLLSGGQIFPCRENARFGPGGPYLFLGPLSDRYIWLRTTRCIFVLRLDGAERWTPITLPNEGVSATIIDNGDYVCVKSSTSISIYGINGRRLHKLKMKDEETICEVACDKYIVYCTKGITGAGEILAWSPWKGIVKPLMHFCDSDIRLHTNKELIYILEVTRPTYRTIMAMDIDIHAVLWVVPLSFPVYWGNVTMKTICGELLFCYLPTGRTSHIRIFTRDGRQVEVEHFPRENRNVKFQDCSDSRIVFSFRSYLTMFNYSD